MYTLRIVDYLKCARSLKSEIFGPAQLMHVSTFDIGIGFITPNVDENGIIADFAAAQKSLNDTLAPPLRFQNLDDVEEVSDINTTSENLCKYLRDQISAQMKGVFDETLRITLHEGRVASATYEAKMP
jgi:6-pyruvoyl-tetrahydropterin synthase